MSYEDKVVDKMDPELIRQYTSMPLIAVYRSPADYPGKFVARLWDAHHPTNLIMTTDSLDELLQRRPPEMIVIGRQPSDDPIIIETWL